MNPNPINNSQLSLTTTLDELIRYVQEHTHKGIRCPVCNGHTKLYKRHINSSNAICLYEMYKISEKEGYGFHHITEMIQKSKKMATRLNGGEFARMRHWGFIEEMIKPKEESNKKTSGFWRMTEAGKAFAKNELKVKPAVLLLNNKLIGFDGEEVSISDCFKTPFDYTSLMADTKITHPLGQ